MAMLNLKKFQKNINGNFHNLLEDRQNNYSIVKDSNADLTVGN